MKENKNIESYIENKIREYEDKLALVEESLSKHAKQDVNIPRDRDLILILNRSQMAYNLCINEFKALQQHIL